MGRHWDKDEILGAIKRMSIQKGRKPKWMDFAPPVPKDYPSIASICKIFGCWSKALKAAGFEPRQMPFRLGPLEKETRQKISEAKMGWSPSEETRKRMSISAKKRCERDGIWSEGLTKDDHPTLKRMSEEVSGENNPMYGRKSLGFTGRKHSIESRQRMSKKQRGRKHSPETIAKQSVVKIGKRNPAWQGGIANNLYPPNFRRSLKGQIRKRDNNICQLCLRPGKCVHHIDYNKDNLDLLNLMVLCQSCNSRVNSNRRFWTALFQGYQTFRFQSLGG